MRTPTAVGQAARHSGRHRRAAPGRRRADRRHRRLHGGPGAFDADDARAARAARRPGRHRPHQRAAVRRGRGLGAPARPPGRGAALARGDRRLHHLAAGPVRGPARTVAEAKRLLGAEHLVIHQVRAGTRELADYRERVQRGTRHAPGRRGDRQHVRDTWTLTCPERARNSRKQRETDANCPTGAILSDLQGFLSETQNSRRRLKIVVSPVRVRVSP